MNRTMYEMTKKVLLGQRKSDDNYALRFDGVDDYATFSTIYLSGNWTFVVKLKTNTSGGLLTRLYGGFLIHSGHFTCRVYDKTYNYIHLHTLDLIDDGNFHELVCVCDNNNNVSLYIDKIPIVNDYEISSNIVGNLNQIDRFHANYYSLHELSKIKLTNYVYTQQDVNDEYNNNLNGVNYILNYDFSGSGCLLNDISGNENHATLLPNCPTNAPEWIKL